MPWDIIVPIGGGLFLGLLIWDMTHWRMIQTLMTVLVIWVWMKRQQPHGLMTRDYDENGKPGPWYLDRRY